jgi:hypothetical protein
MYTKVGRVVHCQGKIFVQSISSAVGTSVKLPLPFNKLNTTNAAEGTSGSVVYDNLSSLSVIPSYIPSSIDQYFHFVVDPSGFTNGHNFDISFSYVAA